MYVGRDDWPLWAPQLAPWLDERFSGDVLSRFNASAEPNWLAWLDEQQSKVEGRRQDSVELFRQVLRERYRGVRVFHATRLTDLDAVRQLGLHAWSAPELREQALAAFAAAAEADILRLAIEENNPEHRGGRVYSFASLNHALGTHDGRKPGKLPSFAVLGGEFLESVGERARVWSNGEQRAGGRGYFFACNLPWDCLEPDDFLWLSKDILLTVIISRFFNTDAYSMFGDRECISTTCDIPPEHIEFFADVEKLRDRDDLTTSDIAWQPFEP